MINRFAFTIIIVAYFLFSNTAIAHISEGTNTLMRLSKTKVSLIYTIPTDNLNELELNSDKAIIHAIRKGFQFKNNQQICPVKFLGKKQLTSVESTQFILDISCSERIKKLDISYTLFLDRFEEHKNKTRISIGSRSQIFVFNQEKKQYQINLVLLTKQWLKQKRKTSHQDNLKINDR